MVQVISMSNEEIKSIVVIIFTIMFVFWAVEIIITWFLIPAFIAEKENQDSWNSLIKLNTSQIEYPEENEHN